MPGFHAFEDRVAQPGGFMSQGPHDANVPHHDGQRPLYSQPPHDSRSPDGHLLLQSVRSHDQFNTTVYGLDDRYRGIKGGRRVVFVNTDDLRDRGFRDGELVDIVSVAHDGERRARGFRAVGYPVAPGCAAAYFPEANVLVPLDSTADVSNTPTFKSVAVRLEAAT